MTLSDYCEILRSAGMKAVPGSYNTLWRSHERFSMLRHPNCALHSPYDYEIRAVFEESHAALLTYVVRAENGRRANSNLYLCTDPNYSLEKLKKNVRYDIRRGLAEFEIRFMDQPEIYTLGKQAYCETLIRTGLSVEQREMFETTFNSRRRDMRYLGAFKNDRLAAFLLIVEVDDWVSIGGYSANDFLALCPNNALVYYATHYYLNDQKRRVVDYGLSSIQSVSNAEGLHKFKTKMGFDCVPVYRAFVANPLLRPFMNRVSWKIVNSILSFSPQHPRLKKIEGVLRCVLQECN